MKRQSLKSVLYKILSWNVKGLNKPEKMDDFERIGRDKKHKLVSSKRHILKWIIYLNFKMVDIHLYITMAQLTLKSNGDNINNTSLCSPVIGRKIARWRGQSISFKGENWKSKMHFSKFIPAKFRTSDFFRTHIEKFRNLRKEYW